jgi:hypothetical protein
MASLVYNSFIDDLSHAAFDLDSATVKVMLTTSAYTENKDTHTKRSDVTNEVVGTGYTAGGNTVTCTLAKDTANDRITLTFAATTWPASTITARKAVYYISRGGASSADELILVDDFGSDVTSTGATFSLASSVITLQN